ncbi:hypothetical protein ACJX0J_019947, partial [Zea mays]
VRWRYTLYQMRITWPHLASRKPRSATFFLTSFSFFVRALHMVSEIFYYRSPMNRFHIGLPFHLLPPEDTSCDLLLLLTASLDEHFVKCSSHVILYPLLARLRILCCYNLNYLILIHYKTLLFTQSWVTLEAYWEKIMTSSIIIAV